MKKLIKKSIMKVLQFRGHIRIKEKNGVYHIFTRCISELLLFKCDNDKDKFLSIVKRAQLEFNFQIFAYCIMPTHYHFMIFCNGADISLFMKNINQSYAQYYNKKYDRHGHVLDSRYNSIILNYGTDSDILTVFSYIHNNPKDINEIHGDVMDYKYSSFSIYIRGIDDEYGLVTTDYILKKLSKNIKESKKLLMDFFTNYVKNHETTPIYSKEIMEQNKHTKYILTVPNISSENKPYKITDITDFVSKITGNSININIKYKHDNTIVKALSVVLLRSVCNYSRQEVCDALGNTTHANVSRLSSIGYDYVINNEKYHNLIDDFINYTNALHDIDEDTSIGKTLKNIPS